jgi:hypothetical protein
MSKWVNEKMSTKKDTFQHLSAKNQRNPCNSSSPTGLRRTGPRLEIRSVKKRAGPDRSISY